MSRSVGGKEKMVPWLQDYFKQFADTSIDAEQMRGHFAKHFPAVAAAVDWDYWFYGEGMPAWTPHASRSAWPLAAWSSRPP